MKSFHIVLPGHYLGEKLGDKNIKIAQKFGLDARLHAGVDGKNTKDLFKKYNITKFAHKGMKSFGQRGCFLAHYQLWTECVKLNEPILICEHDGVFIRKLPENVLNNFSDILRLDAYCHWKEYYIQDVEKSKLSKITYATLPTDFKTYYVGYYGYIIKPCGAKKLIEKSNTTGAMPVDQFIDARDIDIKSVTATVVKLDDYYIGRVAELSTTKSKR